MSFMQALKDDWNKLTTKEGWQQIKYEAEHGKQPRTVLRYNNEPIVVVDYLNPDHRINTMYHDEVMIPRWKTYRKLHKIATLEDLKISLADCRVQLSHYADLEEIANTLHIREKAIIEQVYFTGCITILETEIEEWTEERHIYNLEKYRPEIHA